jgi:hypothetical protein
MNLVRTRHSLHLLAERVISPLRVQVTGNEIALTVRPGGFGTPDLPEGGWVGVVGAEVVRVGEFGEERRAPISSLADAAVVVGLRGGVEDAHLEVDAGAASVLASAWAIGEDALTQLDGDDLEPVRLWPEHFDIATVEGAGDARANYGVSPGDEAHDEPYAYVGPWTAPADAGADPFWNATAFTGAEAPVESVEQVLAFFREGQARLRRGA